MTAAAQAARIASGADQQFWDSLAEGRLQMPRCHDCGRWRWPAVWRCADCGSWSQVWAETPMRGAIYAWARTWHPFGGLERIETPFVTAVVTLEGAGGARLTGLLEGAEDGLAIGAKVRGRIDVTRVAGDSIPSIRWSLTNGGEA
jgi:hypothetical protein